MSLLRALMFIGLGVFALVALRAALGRYAAKLTLGSIGFLVRRWPVLLGWSVGSLGLGALILPGMLAKGDVNPTALAVLVAVVIVGGLGFAALSVGPIFLITRMRLPKPELTLLADETTEQRVKANHFFNGEGRGGELHVTSRRLVFVPHKYNAQLDPWSREHAELTGVDTEGTRVLVIWVRSRDVPAPIEELFVVQDPKAIMEHVARLIQPVEPDADAPSHREHSPRMVRA